MINVINQSEDDADIVIMRLPSGGQLESNIRAYTKHSFDILANSGINAILYMQRFLFTNMVIV